MAYEQGTGGTLSNRRVINKARPPRWGARPKNKRDQGPTPGVPNPSPNMPAWYNNEYTDYMSPQNVAAAQYDVYNAKNNKPTSPYAWYRNDYQRDYMNQAAAQNAWQDVQDQMDEDRRFKDQLERTVHNVFGGGMPINYPMTQDNPFTGDGYTTVKVKGRGTDDRQPVPIYTTPPIDDSQFEVPQNTGMFPWLTPPPETTSNPGFSSTYGGWRKRRPASGGVGAPAWWNALMGLGNWNIG